MKLTYEQNKWLLTLPRSQADHIRRLLKDDGGYSLVSRNGGKTFILVAVPSNSAEAREMQRDDDSTD